MSLFGTSPPADSPAPSSAANSRSLFDDEPASKSASNADSLFADDGFSGDSGSPWDMPTPRKQQSRADVLRTLVPASDAPSSYIDTYEQVVREDGIDDKVNAAGVAKVFAAAKLGADEQTSVMSIVAPNGSDVAIGRDEFNVLLALVGLAQEGETVSLDSVDERRKSKSIRSIVSPAIPVRLDTARWRQCAKSWIPLVLISGSNLSALSVWGALVS